MWIDKRREQTDGMKRTYWSQREKDSRGREREGEQQNTEQQNIERTEKKE